MWQRSMVDMLPLTLLISVFLLASTKHYKIKLSDRADISPGTSKVWRFRTDKRKYFFYTIVKL